MQTSRAKLKIARRTMSADERSSARPDIRFGTGIHRFVTERSEERFSKRLMNRSKDRAQRIPESERFLRQAISLATMTGICACLVGVCVLAITL